MRMLTILVLLLAPIVAHAEDLGNLSANPFDPNSTSNPFGAGSPFAADSINNQFGVYGSPFSNKSANNPYATDALLQVALRDMESGNACQFFLSKLGSDSEFGRHFFFNVNFKTLCHHIQTAQIIQCHGDNDYCWFIV